jgi:hypothetical protein
MDVFSPENHVECSFTELMLNFLMSLSTSQVHQQDVMELLFQAIEEIYYCQEEKLIRFLFTRKDEKPQELYAFSSSLIEQYENTNKGSYIYEREAKIILKSLQILSRFYPRDHPKVVRLIREMINLV